MAEFVAAPDSVLQPIPESVSVDAAGLAQPLAVGLHAARRAGGRDGDRVVLIGAGAIGTFLLAGLRSLADPDVTVVDFEGPRLERASRLGATRVVPAGPETKARVLELLAGPGADVVIEASGAAGQLQLATELVRPGGTILQVGLPSAVQEVDAWSLVMREVTLETTLAHVCGQDLASGLDLLGTTALAAEMLEGVYPLAEVAGQLQRLADGQVEGKILIDPTREG